MAMKAKEHTRFFLMRGPAQYDGPSRWLKCYNGIYTWVEDFWDEYVLGTPSRKEAKGVIRYLKEGKGWGLDYQVLILEVDVRTGEVVG